MRRTDINRFPFFGDLEQALEWATPAANRALARLAGGALASEIREGEAAYTARIEVPGLSKEEIDVKVTGKTLEVRVERAPKAEGAEEGRLLRRERSWEQASRGWQFPEEIDAERVEATLADGVLALRLPKRAAGGSRKVQIL